MSKLIKVSKELVKKKDELDKERIRTEELEKMMKVEKQVSITTNVKIDMTTKIELDNLIKLLESNNAFENDLLEKPPENPNNEKIKGWLDRIKDTIDTSEKIGEGIKTLAPFIGYLIVKFGMI